MSNSVRLQLPWIQPAQAQKHITVNEALARLDGTVNLTILSVDVVTPPNNPLDGEVYAIGSGAVGVWANLDGKIAIASNGGWLFVTPSRGWRAWVDDLDELAVYDGQAWRTGVVSLSPNGAQTRFLSVELLHSISAGNTNAVVAAIPQNAMVLGVTGRVTSTVSGSLATWRIGVSGADDRYGTGLGLAQDSWLRGMSSGPVTYYSDTDLVLTAEGGTFAGGEIRIVVHFVQLEPPIS